MLQKRSVHMAAVILTVCFLIFSACATKTVLDDTDRFGGLDEKMDGSGTGTGAAA